MAATTTELMVRLVADAKGFAAELGDAARTVETTDAKIRRLAASAQDVGRRMTLGFTVPFVAGMGLAVKAASDLEESANKVDVVFGQSAKSIKEWGNNSARSLGLAKAAAFEAVGTFGNLFRAMNVSERESAKMSKSLVQLAADLASFNNANPEDVLLALRSGLVGEAEPLRKFGVSLSAARIEAEAFRLGIAQVGSELTAGQKAQAAYAIIMADTALAQGDFARTSDSLANRMRIAKAEITDAAAEFGAVLLPIVADVAGIVAELARQFAGMPDGVKTAVLAVGGLVAAMGPLLWISGSLVKNWQALKELSPGFAAGLKSLTIIGTLTAMSMAFLDQLGFFDEVASGVTVTVERLSGKKRELRRELTELVDWMERNTRVISEESQALNQYNTQSNAHTRALEVRDAKIKDLVASTRKLALESPLLAREFIEEARAAGLSEAQLARLTATVDKAEQAKIRKTRASEELAAKLAKEEEEFSRLTAATKDQQEALQELTDFVDLQTKAQFGLEAATIGMERAIKNAKEEIAEHGAASLEGREATLRAKQAVEDWGQAVFEQYRLAGASVTDAKNMQMAALGETAQGLAPDSPLRVWLEEYINRLHAIPRSIETAVDAQIRVISQGLGISDTEATAIAALSGLRGFASGGVVDGPIGSPQLALVHGGEAIFNPDQLRALGAAGVGGGTFAPVIHVYGDTSPEGVVAALARWVQSNGALPARVRAAM